jgi:outer membrane protein
MHFKSLAMVAAAVSIAFAASGAMATDYHIGYVNTAKILADSQSAKKIATKLENEFKSRDSDLKKMQMKIQQMQNDLDKNGPTMSDATRTAKERNLADEQRDFKRQQRDFSDDVISARNDALKNLQDRANQAINSIAKSQKFDLILQEPVVYASKRIDITDEVIKTLDSEK